MSRSFFRAIPIVYYVKLISGTRLFEVGLSVRLSLSGAQTYRQTHLVNGTAMTASVYKLTCYVKKPDHPIIFLYFQYIRFLYRIYK